MSVFPRLRTDAISQYPTTVASVARTWVGTFVDGREQRFRQFGLAQRKWVLDLKLLTESEVASIRELWLAIDGPIGTFTFEDPLDGQVYTTCGFASDELATEWSFDGRGETRIVIEQRS